METWVIAAALASIALTGVLAFVLYRMNAGAEQPRRKGDDGASPAYVASDGAKSRPDADGNQDNGDGGGSDGGGDGGGD